MCNHSFKDSIKKGVSYCTKCSILSFNNNISINIPLLSNNIMNLDPLLLKFKHTKSRIDYTKEFNCLYLTFRHVGINQIKKISNIFNLSKNSIYKAINYLDEIYLNYPISPQLIEKISSICLMLSIQFNECCTKKTNEDLIGFRKYLKTIKDIKNIELLCIQCLNYELCYFSSFDYLNLFFSLGFIFPNKNKINQNDINITNLYFQCINILNIIIEDIRYLELDPYILSLSIIKLICSQSIYFNENIIQYIYGINLSKEKYIKCINNIKIILSTLKQSFIDIIYLNNFHMMNNNPQNTYSDSISDNSTSLSE